MKIALSEWKTHLPCGFPSATSGVGLGWPCRKNVDHDNKNNNSVLLAGEFDMDIYN